LGVNGNGGLREVHPSAVSYRPEIDGLRAIAVVPVVLFHAQLGFSGGFIGVDVFFVISGYLITSQILKEGEAFSLGNFWERRVRRIFPAASVMVLASLVAAWFLLLPLDFARFARSLVAQSLLVSNVYFMRDINYFVTDAVRPLLHTWSLAVEEQFYLVLPFLLYVFRRVERRKLVLMLLAASLVSLAASAYGVRSHPSPTFYLLPTRAWELLIGSLLAALPGLRLAPRGLSEVVGGVGLLGILLAAIFYQTSTPFPGAWALPPCLGAAAIIVSSVTPTLVSRLLSLPPFVAIGRISYSLYLWHWPLLTFARYQLGSWSTRDGLVLVVVSCLMAWLSLKLVEQPVRARRYLVGRRPLFAAMLLTVTAFLGSGVAIVRANGVESRWRPEALQYAQGKLDFDFRYELSLDSARRGELTTLGVPNAEQPIELLVWGDSHAMSLLHVVDVVCRERGLRCLAATHSSTAPLLDYPGVGQFSLQDQALPFSRAITDFVRTQRVKRVVLAAYWSSLTQTSQLRASFSQTVDVLRKAGATVIILKDVPVPGFDVPIALAQAVSAGKDLGQLGADRAKHAAGNRAVDAIIDDLVGSAVVVDPAPWFSAGSGPYRIQKDGHALYFDFHHLSIHGAMQLRPLFERVLSDGS